MIKNAMRRYLLPASYILIALFIIVSTIVLVAYGQGYSYDFKHNRFVLRGLVVISSTPSGGEIKLGGRHLRNSTPYRATLEVGDYNFQVARPGFSTWAKDLVVTASRVTWAQYVWLFPQKLSGQVITNPQQSVDRVAAAKDHRHFALIEHAPDQSLWTFDSQTRQLTPIYTAKPEDASTPAEQLLGATWAPDNSALILRTQTGDKLNFWLLSSGGNDKTNLTDLFKVDFGDLRFNPTNIHQLYSLNPDGLRLIDTSAKTVSAVLADKVSAFTFGADRVFYIQTTALGKSLWSLDKAGVKQELIQSLAASDSYELSYNSFNGKDWVAVIPAQSRTLTLYSDVLSAHPRSKVISKQADHAQFNSNGQFLAFWGGSGVGSYDLDQDVIYNLSGDFGDTSELSWLDNYHLVQNAAGTVKAMDYDGTNVVNLLGVLPGTPLFLAADHRNLVTMEKANSSANTELDLFNLRP